MKRRLQIPVVLCAIAVLGMLAPNALGGEKGTLSAGAAKVDITPDLDLELTMSGYRNRTDPAEGILDHLFARAIVLDDGSTRAAIVVMDLISVKDDFWEEVTTRIERETGIPAGNVLLAAIHTHSGPSLGFYTDEISENAAKYTRELADKLLKIVKQASDRLQPAVMGVGQGRANVNINRVARLAGGRYWLGKNPEGASDKTVHVIRFDTPDGKPIAVFVNYGVHCTALGSKSLKYSGNVGGATSRYLEEHYGDDFVAIWTSGAAGDQNPLYDKVEGGSLLAAMGEILGEETIRVCEDTRMSPAMQIQAEQKVVTCPGKKNASEERYKGSGEYKFVDADPVPIRLSLLMLNHVALAGVSGEVLTMIGQRLKAESPFNQTIMVTHCNGLSGYLPDDEAYKIISYETASTHVKEGAEDAIVNTLVDMMDGM